MPDKVESNTASIKPEKYSKYTSFVNLCYTGYMPKDRSFWPEWAHFLQQSGLNEFAAALLDAGGSLNMFLAQMVYAGRPFLSELTSKQRVDALASLFEDQEESRSFAAFIREELSE
jgi:hypothetical protein